MYNFTALSRSADLIHLSSPEILTEKDKSKNYCSPSSIIERGGEYILCVTSYPMPEPYSKCGIADENARIYTII